MLLLPKLLKLLLLLWAGTRAQSGDGDADIGLGVSCSSDISLQGNELTCQLFGGRDADEDDEDSDTIERMSMCYTDYSSGRTKCEESSGNRIRPTMSPLSDFALTLHLKGGSNVTAMFNLQKIVKPRRPSVQNVSFHLDSNQAVVDIQTPYHNDYLKIENQLFQLHICTAGVQMTQNVSASDNMKIDMRSLQPNTEYRVRVRAIPISHLQGSWSEWSETFGFVTPAGEKPDDRQQGFVLVVCVVSLLVVTVSAGFLWKNRIFTYMWPRIPHPKHTLVQICPPNKGLLLSFSPEVFSALKVFPMEKAAEDQGEEVEPSLAAAAADGTGSQEPGSIQSSCRSATSVSTEELELSALMSLMSSSDGEESLQSSSPSPVNGHSSEGHPGDLFSIGQQEEAYVTMSSFYQTK